ncbi:MAG: hypothetical protein IIW42_04100 [Bacteroidaceae bacterium]|nr:hypothetical protein [Bacteroidaceae bacterium]
MARSISSIILHHYLADSSQIYPLTLEIARDYLSQLHAHLRADLKPFRERQGINHAWIRAAHFVRRIPKA